MGDKNKKGEKMKINIKERRIIKVNEVRTIGFKNVQTINFMVVNKKSIAGENIKVNRV